VTVTVTVMVWCSAAESNTIPETITHVTQTLQ